jgi:hypothetical protein
MALPVPDLSAGHCQPGNSDLPPDAWLTDDSREQRNKAIRACRACPVLTACRDWVLSVDETGYILAGPVIAGMSASERRTARGTRP